MAGNPCNVAMQALAEALRTVRVFPVGKGASITLCGDDESQARQSVMVVDAYVCWHAQLVTEDQVSAATLSPAGFKAVCDVVGHMSDIPFSKPSMFAAVFNSHMPRLRSVADEHYDYSKMDEKLLQYKMGAFMFMHLPDRADDNDATRHNKRQRGSDGEGVQ